MAKILLVEDEADTRDLIRAVLEMDGHEVVESTSAEDGMREAQAQTPQVILMDISLAGAFDGLEATRRLRADSTFDHTPIIALTAHAMRGDRERILAAGCDDHWAKPIMDLVNFKEMVTRLAADGRSSTPQE
jgi:two-component system, cell cycle response regulator DivK